VLLTRVKTLQATRSALISTAAETWDVIRSYLRLDLRIGLFSAVYLILALPTVPRNTENPQRMAAVSNDEPYLVMALDSTIQAPFGNPANYFDVKRSAHQFIPNYWGNLRYDGINYYGGAMYTLAFPIYVALRALGLPPFPTAPIILRLLVAFAGLAALITLYNIGRNRGLSWAGLLASVYILGDTYFIYYSTNIHPDALQLAFGLFSFVAASRHIHSGRLTALAAFGVFCGLVQASKFGGLWLLPTAFIVVLLGRRREQSTGLPARLALLAASGFLVWFVASPYTFLDGYYFRSLLSVWGIIHNTPFGQADQLVWARATWAHFGQVASVIGAATIARGLYMSSSARRDPEPLLAAVFALSQFFWYASSSPVWSQIGYLLVGTSLLVLFSLETIAVVGHLLLRAAGASVRRVSRPLGAIGVLGLAMLILQQRTHPLITAYTNLLLGDRSTVLALNDWAVGGGIPLGSKIIFDDLAYFDPQVFPTAHMHGGVLTWNDVNKYDPDYIVLSSSLYGSTHYTELRRTQKLERDDPYAFSMRFYQDVLTHDDLGPTDVPGITLVKIMRPEPFAYGTTLVSATSAWFNAAFSASRAPISGPELRLFRVAHPGSLNGRQGPFASGTLVGYSASYIADRTRAAWAADKPGPGSWVAYDFGSGATAAVRKLAIEWVAPYATPLRLRVEFSDDAEHYQTATVLDTGLPPDSPLWAKRDYELPDVGRHRIWRAVAADISSTAYFAVAELRFVEIP